MSLKTLLARIGAQEDLNFLLTNRVPRKLLTHGVGWLSRQQQPLIYRPALWLWQLFSDLDLSEAKQSRFRSLHECFTRELKAGARPIDVRSDIITSPCDAIVGACGAIEGQTLWQAKGYPYTLMELLGNAALAERYRDGVFVTLRLTSSMYHRFHAPAAGVVNQVNYISGDTWNVNPIALKRVEKLFCKNERAVIQMQLASGPLLTLVPVAAILVASIRLHWLNVRLHLRYRGPNVIPCHASFSKGQEMGWFEHGSTIIVFAPRGMRLVEEITTGSRIKMGQALLAMPDAVSA